jgi:hypothetical protein
MNVVNLVVQKYIPNPLLLNGHKFDLRLYVLVVCVDPLRVYLYKEGMARLATEPYNSEGDFENQYVHLTNYAINKTNKRYFNDEE